VRGAGFVALQPRAAGAFGSHPVASPHPSPGPMAGAPNCSRPWCVERSSRRGSTPRGWSYGDLRWTRLKNLEAKGMYTVVPEHVFAFLRTVGSNGSTDAAVPCPSARAHGKLCPP
jgi:hypothetical protein